MLSTPPFDFLSPRHQRVFLLFLSPFLDDQGSFQSVVSGLITLFVVGGLIGLGTPKNPALPSAVYRTISASIGYIYFLCWSVSFYPQVIQNYKTKSTTGLSIDFCGLNVLGFSCYSVYNLAFFWASSCPDSELMRLYRKRHGDSAEITVQSNDVAFAVHALLLSTITLLQIVYYSRYYNRNREGGADRHEHQRRPSKPIRLVMGGILAASVVYPILTLLLSNQNQIPNDDDSNEDDIPFFNWLDFLYLLGNFKIFISLIKYIPQVLLNIQRRSTKGWSIWNIILDATGGLLSDFQLVSNYVNMYDGCTLHIASFCLFSSCHSSYHTCSCSTIICTIHPHILYTPYNTLTLILHRSWTAEI